MPEMSSPALAGSCQFIETGVYAEYLLLQPIASVADSHDFAIRSRLDSARDPQALQARYRVTLTTQALARLHAHLGDYLGRCGALTSLEDRTPG